MHDCTAKWIPFWNRATRTSCIHCPFLTGTCEWKQKSSGPEWEPASQDLFTGKWVSLTKTKIPTCIAVSVCRLMKFLVFSCRPLMPPTWRSCRSCKKDLLFYFIFYLSEIVICELLSQFGCTLTTYACSVQTGWKRIAEEESGGFFKCWEEQWGQ